MADKLENLKKGKRTQFKSGEKAAASGRKGGIASGIAKREKKTVREIVVDLLDGAISEDSSLFQTVAKKAGIDSSRSKKELFVAVCILNTLKKGDINDIEKLTQIIGESLTAEKNDGILPDLLAFLKGEK